MKKVKLFFMKLLLVFLCFSTITSVHAQKPKKFFKQAEKQQKAENYSEAIVNYSRVVQLDVENLNAFINRAFCYEKIGDLASAANDYESAFRLKSKEQEYAYKAALNFFKSEQYDKALIYLNKAIELDKKYIEALELKAEIQLEQKKYNAAFATTNTALDVGKNPNLMYMKGVALANMGSYGDAQKYFKKVSKDKYHYQSKVWYAKTLIEDKDYDGAKKHLAKANLINPNYAQFYKVRGELNEKLSDIPSAMNDYETYCKMEPDDIEMQYKSAAMDEEMTNYGKALNCYNSILNRSDEEYNALYLRAKCLQRLNKNEDAVTDYTELIENEGSNAEASVLVEDAKKQVFHIRRESNSPVITIFSPIQQNGNIITKNSTFVLKANVFEENSLQEVRLNGELVQCTKVDKGFAFEKIVDANQTALVKIEAVDNYGNRGEVSFPVVYNSPVAAAPVVVYNTVGSSNTGYAYLKESDIDNNIPESGASNNYNFALIIGNEDYASYQTDLDSEVNVKYAKNDAHAFKEYAINVLGVPDRNVIFVTDATSGQMNQNIAKFTMLMDKTKGEGSFYFYYAGHGMPDEKTKEPFLMPVDISGANVTSGVSLDKLYKKFTSHPSKRVMAFVDACFSGGSRDKGLIAARGVKIVADAPKLKGNLIVMSASKDDQSSLPYDEKKHGIFTYFLLKKLQETNGNITLGELSTYVKEKVDLESLMINNKEQTPFVGVSDDIDKNWESWMLVEPISE